jgi:hypothetical protein
VSINPIIQSRTRLYKPRTPRTRDSTMNIAVEPLESDNSCLAIEPFAGSRRITALNFAFLCSSVNRNGPEVGVLSAVIRAVHRISR